eukprot:CAMPEP_0177583334 /NCGR_PEP_ID=MMETSP0419_2-20121207/3261_1 /TAXON_ID=582737 /ORGANISM="Tetraselmis sp., Strain GSL018" /LENGTH=174 /DNA_ID=CAMNT_0019072707 /DNA_START=225 /DNA_END=751 /DNA_ORIENTATION=+
MKVRGSNRLAILQIDSRLLQFWACGREWPGQDRGTGRKGGRGSGAGMDLLAGAPPMAGSPEWPSAMTADERAFARRGPREDAGDLPPLPPLLEGRGGREAGGKSASAFPQKRPALSPIAEDADDARHARLPGAAATAAVPRAPLERHLRSKAVSDKDDGSLQVQSSLPKSLLKH